MKNEQGAVPKLRFPGFTDEWEQCELGEMLIEYKEKTVCNNQYPALTSSRKGIFLQTDYYGGRQIASEDNTGYNIVPYGYFTYRHMSDDEIFHFNINNIVENGIVSTLYPVFTTTEALDSAYLQYQLNHGREFAKYALLQKQGGSRTYMYFSKLAKLKLTMPTLVEEQKRIGEFFTRFDNLITLQQRKLDQIKEYKKGMLQKMFPKEGESVPEVRFPGFTGEWELKKVTDLGEIYIGLVTTMTSHYTDCGTLLIRNSDIRDSRFEFGDSPIYLDKDFATRNASRKHKVGDVITVHTGDIGTSAVITEKEANSIGFATIVTRPYKDIITPDYLCTYLNTDAHKRFAMGISTGDGRNNYNLKDYYECIVPVPCIAEQMIISAFMKRMTSLLNLHQRKLDQMKEYKKGLLQQMFV